MIASRFPDTSLKGPSIRDGFGAESKDADFSTRIKRKDHDLNEPISNQIASVIDRVSDLANYSNLTTIQLPLFLVSEWGALCSDASLETVVPITVML